MLQSTLQRLHPFLQSCRKSQPLKLAENTKQKQYLVKKFTITDILLYFLICEKFHNVLNYLKTCSISWCFLYSNKGYMRSILAIPLRGELYDSIWEKASATRCEIESETDKANFKFPLGYFKHAHFPHCCKPFDTFSVLKLAFFSSCCKITIGMNKHRCKIHEIKAWEVASEFDYDHKMNRRLFLSAINLCNKHHLQKQIKSVSQLGLSY